MASRADSSKLRTTTWLCYSIGESRRRNACRWSPHRGRGTGPSPVSRFTIHVTSNATRNPLSSVSHFHSINGTSTNLMDIVFIKDLEIETVIGIYDWERKIRQVVCLNLEMGTDIRRAAASDRIEDTLDYKAVAKRLIGFVEKSSFGLVETLAERCAEIVLDEFPVEWLKLRLDKPGAVRGSKSVGIIIERGRRP